MAIFVLTSLIDVVVEESARALAHGLTKHETTTRILKKLKLDILAKSPDFDILYSRTLVEFGVFKPRNTMNFFRNDYIRQAFLQAFKENDHSILVREAQDVVEWNRETGELGSLSSIPWKDIAEFTSIFNALIGSTLTPIQAKQDRLVQNIDANTTEILQRLERLETLSDFVAELRDIVREHGAHTSFMSISHPAPLLLVDSGLDRLPSTEEMIYIPEGDFYIDKYPVTRWQYKARVAEWSSRWERPVWIRKEESLESYQGYPVTNLTFENALDFAYHLGKNLPTTEEWKIAALSGLPDKVQPYPWGYEFGPFCNTRETGRHMPMSVLDEANTYKLNTNPAGMSGIIGNVAELVVGEDNQPRVCGGSFRERGKDISIHHSFSAPSSGSSLVSFRCIQRRR
jgi:hypothetical protein